MKMHSIGQKKSEQNLLPQDGVMIYRPDLFGPVEALGYLQTLSETIEWEKPSIKMYGKSFPIPRLAAWYGNPEATYKYSGIINVPKPWTKELLAIKKKVEAASDQQFNSVLLNYYRDGSDHMSWHADDEKSLGENPVIASVSFGEVRKFGVKHRYEKDLESLSFELGNGSLVLMKGEMQEFWHHRIHPTKKLLGPRINLTFRKVFTSS